MSDLVLTSGLSADYYEALEKLLFFNSEQSHVLVQIEQAVAEFGMPKIVNDGGWLRIRLAQLDEAQIAVHPAAGNAAAGADWVAGVLPPGRCRRWW